MRKEREFLLSYNNFNMKYYMKHIWILIWHFSRDLCDREQFSTKVFLIPIESSHRGLHSGIYFIFIASIFIVLFNIIYIKYKILNTATNIDATKMKYIPPCSPRWELSIGIRNTLVKIAPCHTNHERSVKSGFIYVSYNISY